MSHHTPHREAFLAASRVVSGRLTTGAPTAGRFCGRPLATQERRRQQISMLGLDAQACLESLEALSGSAAGPVVVHGVGLGTACAIHMAMAAQVMPAPVDRRIRLLVLDSGFGAVDQGLEIPRRWDQRS